MNQPIERILAFKSAQTITNDELKEIGGGMALTTTYCSKQTYGSGQWDFGVDVQWD